MTIKYACNRLFVKYSATVALTSCAIKWYHKMIYTRHVHITHMISYNDHQLKMKCKKVYLTMSAKASGSDFSLYGMLYLAHKTFTCGWILYKLWRGIVGNKLQTSCTKVQDMHPYKTVHFNYLSNYLSTLKKIREE